jgi:glutamate N-acetyltransferase/amino-acid N-acetyltransferase
MAVGKNKFPEMNPIPGIKLGTASANIKKDGGADLLVIEMAEGSTCAGVFTQNAFCAAPVVVAKQNLPNHPRWLLVNSGNANAGTGHQGIQDAWETCGSLAVALNGKVDMVLPFSTGIIGEALPVEKIKKTIPLAVQNQADNNWDSAAKAIMTTDTFPKGSTRVIEVDGKNISISGISKGSGMIQPNMATMLAFIATDAKISTYLLQWFVDNLAEKTFNRITVDGDTSTNDACILMASGHSSADEITESSSGFDAFHAALEEVFQELAEAIIRDGEGATKLIRIIVEQARDASEAVRVAKTVAHSPLVKTAFFASDPNWGRILAAVGRADIEDIEIENIVIFLGDVCIVRNGSRAESYTEKAGQEVMEQEQITVTILLGRGQAKEEVLTCDFSYDYVRINAEYRT